MKTHALLCASLLAGLSGCFTPAPVVRLTPDMPGVVFQDGRAITATHRPGLRVAMAFEEAAERIVMRVEVENSSPFPLDIDPAKMVFKTCAIASACTPSRGVVNPEAMLMLLDQARSMERASQANDAAVGMTFTLLDATLGVAAAVAGDHKTAGRALDNAVDTAAQTSDSIHRADARISGIDAAREKWATVALRRTTLQPGRATGGYLYLPVDHRASLVWVSVRIHGQDNWFRFKQVVFDPYAGQRHAE